MIETLTILGGRGRDGEREPLERVDLRMGDVVRVVGPTGSGKSTLVNDLELLSDGDTPTGRRILLNGAPFPDELRGDPAAHPIALITQHTSFLSDLPVREFLRTHARVRRGAALDPDEAVARALEFANELTGEPIAPQVRMTELSGGQTRALLIADATVVCATPIVLLDEVENAGIDRSRALALLRRHRKIFVFVTHDPHVALLSDARIVLRGGAMADLVVSGAADRRAAGIAGRLDSALGRLRETIRAGGRLVGDELEAFA